MALFSTLLDNFDDNSINSSLWTTFVDGAASVAETGGKVQVTLPASSGGDNYSGYTSLVKYDLTNNAVFVEVPTPNTAMNGEQYLVVYDQASVSCYIEVVGSQIYFVTQGGGFSSTVSTTFNTTTDRWWRIRHTSSPSKLWMDTSPDGTTWTNRANNVISFSITSLLVEIAAGTYAANPTLIRPTFDNFNYTNSNVTATGSASGGGTLALNSETASTTVQSSASGGGMVTYLTEFQPLPQKDYEYRIFTHSGTYIGVWDNIASDFSYSQTINQNASELTVNIGRSPDNRVVKLDTLLDDTGALIKDENSDNILLQTETANAVGPGTDVDYNYNVDVYAFYGGYESLLDENGQEIKDDSGDIIYSQYGFPNGKRVYSGYIVDYELTYGKTTGVTATIAPHATEMNHYIFKDGSGNTTVSYGTGDPIIRARDNMDNYITQGGRISYTTATIPLSGASSPGYDFKLQRTREVNDKVVEMLPSGWYQFVDPGENLQYIQAKGSVADHTFWYEKHISELKLKNSISQLVNKSYFTGGDTGGGAILYTYDEDTSSISSIRPGLDIQSDSRVTLTTSAHILSQRQIAEYKNPRYRSSVTITDAVYDIELIQLGDMVGFRNFGTFADSLILQVVTLHREKHSVTLDLDTTLPSDAKRLEDLKRAILSEQVRDIPAVPV